MHTVAMPERHRFHEIQRAFAASIRAPQQTTMPADVPARRMAVYGELFFANISEQLATTFPVLKAISPAEYWQTLCRGFFARHHCTSPLFHELPREFLAWLEQGRAADASDPAWLLELAHYEWVELALSLAEDELPPADATDTFTLQCIPRLSPLAWNLGYHFPVHRIGPSCQPTEPAPVHLLVYRNRQDQVGFMELNAVSARLLQLIEEDRGMSGHALLDQIAAELQHAAPAAVHAGGSGLLHTLYRSDILL